jgi:hypothetical protein
VEALPSGEAQRLLETEPLDESGENEGIPD